MTAMQEQQESAVGVIPAGWSIASLGDLGSCIRGVSYKPEHLMQKTGESVTTLLRSNNIKNDRVNFDDVQFVAGCKISEGQLARPFDIAICMSNGSKALVGKSGVITPAHLARHPRLTVGAFCAIYRSPVQYTAQIFKSQFFQSAIDVQLAGSAINNLKGSDIEGIRFPLPPHREQKAIAAILTAVDEKLDVIARQIEATQTLKQGLMQTLFSRGVGTQDADGRWVSHAEFKDSELGLLPAAWTVVSVGDVCDVRGGKRLPKGESLTTENTGYPYVRVSDMYMGGVDTSNILYVPAHLQPGIARYTISKDDIFISVAGTLGIVGVIPEELDGANLTENADKLTDIKISRDYLFHCLCSEPIQQAIAREATSNAQPKLALARIRDFRFPLPPAAEQREIAAILGAVDEKRGSLAAKHRHYQTLKRGLMQKLLTGEWRVKVDAEMAA